MFSRDDHYRDTLMAAGGLVGIAAVLSGLLGWALRGLAAANADLERFEPHSRAWRDVAGTGLTLTIVAILLASLILGSLGLALWMVIGGWRARRARGERGARAGRAGR